MLSHLSSFYIPSHCAIGHFSFTIAKFQCFPLFNPIHKFGTCLLYNTCISMHRNVFTFEIPIAYICTVAGSMLNDRLVPIVTSYRVVVVARSGGGLVRSLDNPSTSFFRKYSKYCHDEATENPMYQTYSSSTLVTG